jgi:hypothetical protein
MAFKNRLYPHLLPDDIPVWERYLSVRGPQYDYIDYDVQVGFGSPSPPDISPEIEKARRHLTRRRIDAIGYTDQIITLIEVTRLADLKAIGQLVSYPLLYGITYRPRLPVRMLLVCEKLHTDIEHVIPHLPVEVWLSPGPN